MRSHACHIRNRAAHDMHSVYISRTLATAAVLCMPHVRCTIRDPGITHTSQHTSDPMQSHVCHMRHTIPCMPHAARAIRCMGRTDTVPDPWLVVRFYTGCLTRTSSSMRTLLCRDMQLLPACMMNTVTATTTIASLSALAWMPCSQLVLLRLDTGLPTLTMARSIRSMSSCSARVCSNSVSAMLCQPQAWRRSRGS